MFFVSFIALSGIFYLFNIGFVNAGDKKVFSFKYPFAISLIIWVGWHFYLFPPDEEVINIKQTGGRHELNLMTKVNNMFVPKNDIIKNDIFSQTINMDQWI